jgi:hypothetical protein
MPLSRLQYHLPPWKRALRLLLLPLSVQQASGYAGREAGRAVKDGKTTDAAKETLPMWLTLSKCMASVETD